MKTLKLAIFVEQPFWFDGEKYTTDSPFLQVLSFSTYFNAVHLFVPVQYSKTKKGGFLLGDSMNKDITIHPLPFFEKSSDVYRHPLKIIPKSIKVIWKHIDDWDVGCIVDYHILSIIFFYISKIFKKRLFNYFRSDVIEEFSAHVHEGMIKNPFLCHLANILDFFAKLRTRSAFTIVIGNKLYTKYVQFGKDVFIFYPTRICEKDILRKDKIRPRNTDIVKLLTAGRLTPEKGLIYLLNSLKEIKNRENKHKFVLSIVGSGKMERELKNATSNWGLSDSVIFQGYISSKNELLALYDDADIFLLPSLTEGIPKTLYEAMAKEVPVIATSVGGVPDIVKDGENGLLVPPANSEAIVKAILRLVNDEELRFKLIKNGLETVKEYTLEKQRDRMINILESHFGLEINKPVC